MAARDSCLDKLTVVVTICASSIEDAEAQLRAKFELQLAELKLLCLQKQVKK